MSNFCCFLLSFDGMWICLYSLNSCLDLLLPEAKNHGWWTWTC
uniref:Uncharacterized protein n=1 Tax=Setaria viridis TaxID=4556 RepID=A0A4V6D8E0_SETVI|nr:hypothetical protein SEVIR_4G144002v2 [Setaria viridis]